MIDALTSGRSRLCIATVAFADYRAYIPYYVHSILETYPDYFVRLFVTDAALPAAVEAAVDWLRDRYRGGFEVHLASFPDLPPASTVVWAGKTLGKYLRWLLSPTEFAGFAYGYVGDVDFLIMPEPEPLLEVHVRHCHALQVPYSNMVRTGTRKLTGLHFIEVESYFRATAEHIRAYRDAKRLLGLRLRDEEFLYSLVEATIGFGRMAELPRFRPHHGFHLGCVRGGNEEYLRRWIDDERQRQLLARYFDSESFGAIHELVRHRDVETLVRRVRERSP